MVTVVGCFGFSFSLPSCNLLNLVKNRKESRQDKPTSLTSNPGDFISLVCSNKGESRLGQIRHQEFLLYNKKQKMDESMKEFKEKLTEVEIESEKFLLARQQEQSFWISEKGVLADRISPGVMRSLVNLTDKPKTVEHE
ncbi:hypothetical protein Leryth_025000 [Lithospermum erythrorhizon]|nr:hypothetical protein Leryth_025000 [Lithospermum erythrorhizon]